MALARIAPRDRVDTRSSGRKAHREGVACPIEWYLVRRGSLVSFILELVPCVITAHNLNCTRTHHVSYHSRLRVRSGAVAEEAWSVNWVIKRENWRAG
jgi:hypothetical protein